ncbi:hypothetical protein ABZ721_10795 [Streptomyces sp. NPDC006733]|uniref:DUF7848 domain-containing protein n=1 Tax=Streptomyces sp. NPDC006733 TaxID=3155460 RepID=UPI0033DCD6B4
MGVRAVLKFVDWMLQLDTSACLPIFEIQCTACGEKSVRAESADEPQIWALRHAGLSGHVGFWAMTTCSFKASPVEAEQ